MNVVISTEYLDTKRRAYNSTYAKDFAGYLQLKYTNYKPVVIYVSDDDALVFARDYLTIIFPKTPVIFSGINNYDVWKSLDTSLFTGAFELKEVAPNLEWLLKIDRNVTDLVFVGDGSGTCRDIDKQVHKDVASYHLHSTYINEKRLDRAVERLNNAPSKYLILTTIGGMTDTGGHLLPLRQIVKTFTHCGRIVISMEDTYVMEGVLGGYVTNGRNQGKSAANCVLAFLHGKAITDLPPTRKSPNVYVFDDRVLQKLNISLPGSVRSQAVIFNPRPDFYQRYHILLLGSLLGFIFLFFLTGIISFVILLKRNRELTRVKNALQRSEESYRNQFVNNSSIMFLVDPSDGAITDANTAAQKFYGYPRERLQTLHLTDIDILPAPEIKKTMDLVVDDNATNRDVLVSQLAAWGVIAECAVDGAAALSTLHRAEDAGNPFVGAILDMQMPGMTGGELAQAIKADETLKHIRLILMTSIAQRGDAKRMHELGFVAYLTKPLRQSDLYKYLTIALCGPASKPWPQLSKNGCRMKTIKQRSCRAAPMGRLFKALYSITKD